MDLEEVKKRRRTCNQKDGFIISHADYSWLIAEVERLTAGIQKALDNPGARAYILEHTLKNGAGGCCEGRCQGHSVPEAVKP